MSSLIPADKEQAHLVQLHRGQEWLVLMSKREPQHLSHICEHGWHVGHNRVHEAKCPFCSGKKEVPAGFVTAHPSPPLPRKA
jgi:hypothetical protein